MRAARPARARVVAGAAAPQPASPPAPPGSSFHHGVTLTSYEGNCMAVKFNNTGARVLVDPWLLGDLTFFDLPQLYTGRKRRCGGAGGGVGVDVAEVAADTDVILISQWVDDHTHIPTLTRLAQLAPQLPVVAQPEAAARIAPLGFASLTPISPGQSLQLCGGRLALRATAGALVGPPWSARQNGFLIEEAGVDAPARLYYEPHCDFDAASLAGFGPVDVVVSPVQSVLLAGYPLLKGDTDLIRLLKLLTPKVLVPLLNADLDQEGFIEALMSVRGSAAAADLRAALAAAGLDTRLEYPAPPGESLALAL